MAEPVQPVRLQRSRAKGSRLVSPNGLPVVCCTRPGEHANPFKVGGHFRSVMSVDATSVGWFYVQSFAPCEGYHTIRDAAESLEWYRRYAIALLAVRIRRELAGRNLACWCKLCPRHAKTGKPLNEACADCAPCHVDVLGEILILPNGGPSAR